jgi:AcrR family transcriptional regulator
MEEGRSPYRVPQQKRSKESLERLLDAAEDQIRAEGIESLTIATVVSRAGLSVGAFYARFPDRNALLHAVQGRFHDRVEPVLLKRVVSEVTPEECLADAVEVAVDLLVGHVLGEQELSRAFMMSSVFDPVLRARGEQVNRARRDVLVSVLMPHCDEIRHEDPVLAIYMAYGMYAAVIRGALVFGFDHELYSTISNQTVVGELKQALTLYLKGEPPS